MRLSRRLTAQMPMHAKKIRKMSAAEAVKYMMDNDLCNPHQMVRDERKMDARKQFFKEFFGNSNVYMVNTILTPQETQDEIRKIVIP